MELRTINGADLCVNEGQKLSVKLALLKKMKEKSRFLTVFGSVDRWQVPQCILVVFQT